MDKLKHILEQYSRWQPLDDYVIRIEGYLQTDFSLAIENAKALLETISKEICKQKGIGLKKDASVNHVIKKAFAALGLPGSHNITQISSALATIGQNVGDIRNQIGTTSHGKTLDEIRERNDQVDDLTREFLIDSTVIVACFLIRTFEQDNPFTIKNDKKKNLIYHECEAFNGLWDEYFGEFDMGDYSYAASEILFSVDYQAYETEYRAYEQETE